MLNVGDLAPDFTLPTETGVVTLSALRGQKVILYFYPKDETSGCTKEACDFRDAHEVFLGKAVIIGVSKDSVASHIKFKAKHNLPFILGADTEGKACEAYGVWVAKSMYGRSYFGIERATFLIDTEGKIGAIWRKVKVTGHVKALIKHIS